LGSAAVFCGGFDVDAAVAVLGPEAIDRLQALRERSLLCSPEPGRFALYESIRAFAAEQLDARGDREAAEARHRDHYLVLGSTEADSFERGGPLVRLARERDNLLAVFGRALRAGRTSDASRALLALGPVLATQGPAGLHLELLDQVMAELEDDPALLHARARARRALGELDGAEADLLAALEGTSEGPLYVGLRKDLGVLYHQRRAIDQARACYEAALHAARAGADRRAEGIITGNLGALAHDIGRFEEAAELYQSALDRLRAAGDSRLEGIFLTNLGVLEQEQGRAAVARKHYRRAIELSTSADDRRYLAITLGNLGVLEHDAGAFAEARQRHEQALELLERVGDRHSEALCRARLGAVLADLGEVEAAEACLERAERSVLERDALALALVRLYHAFVDLAHGDEAAALRRIELAQSDAADGAPSLAEVSDDARLVLRLLAHRLSSASGTHLEVGPTSSWFRAPGGPRQKLDKHSAARRILERMVSERLENPGHGVAGEELFAAGWPGVRIQAQSASNRLYVALAKLRKMGLKLLILRAEDGYLLDPGTPVLRVD
jgi:tetratricopeptide (TPR) repeat protein